MKKLFALLALCAFALTACENNGGVDEPVNGSGLTIKLTSKSVMDFTAEGGEGVIIFDLIADETRAEEGLEVVPSTTADWITDLTVADKSVTFNVAPNTNAARNASIKVSYASQSFQVMVQQEGVASIDHKFTATHLGGTYYGKLQSRGFDYFLILSDMQPEGIMSIPYGATEYRFDIYAAEGSAFNTTHRVPVGVYTIDHARSGEPGTIDAYRDCSYVYGPDIDQPYLDGTLTVTEDSIIADITLMDGKRHVVEYYGSTVMEDYSQPTYADVTPVSQHTVDINFDVTGGYIYAYYRGDWFGIGYDNWFLHMIESKQGFSGVYLLFDFIVPKSVGGFENKDGFVGEYTIFSDKPEDYSYTIAEGRLRDDSQQLHAWYLECVSGQVDMSKAAPLKGGTVKVEKSASGYVLTIDSFDDNGNKIQGTFEGVLGEYDDQNKD